MTQHKNFRRVILLGAVAGLLISTAPFTVDAASPAKWKPKASEQLIKLPGDFLKKAVDNDFANSALASAMSDSDEKIYLKKSTLRDLQAAIERAEGDVKIELEHQLLAEKSDYIEQVKEYQKLRQRRAKIKIRLYEKLLGKLNVKERAMTPARMRLKDQQNQARLRMESTTTLIDTQLLKSSMAPESRYSKEYTRNLTAIDNLVQAINAHPMNQQPEIDGQPLSQQDYLRQLIAGNESELAILDQERAVLGYMAKLVSLDALALSEGIQTNDDITLSDESENPGDIASAVELFINQ
jgi:hypothetical protein